MVATGVATTVRDFADKAFQRIGLDIDFQGNGEEEHAVLNAVNEALFVERVGENYLKGIKERIGDTLIAVDPAYFRPAEVETLLGDARKAHEKLHWAPRYSLEEIIDDMMQHDVALMKREAYLNAGGFQICNYFE